MIKKVEIFNYIGQGFFSAVYKKVNGDERKLLGKLHVKDEKFFAGGELKGNRDHLLECIDVNVLRQIQKDGGSWRSIQLNNLISLKVKGEELVKKGESNAIAA